jgi:hypothetical protein
LFHQAGGKWIQPPNVLTPPPAGQLALGAITGLPEVNLAHLVLSGGVGWYAFPDDVLLQPSAGQQNEIGLADNGSNFLEAYAGIVTNLRAWAQRREMIAALRRLNPSVASVELAMPGRDKIVVGHEVGGKVLVLDLDQESEGLRRFLAYLLALYQNPPKQTLILEDPEKGLHPGALAVLAEQIKACPLEGRGQVLLTTHSPDLLDHFPPDVLRVVELHDYQTRIGPVAPEQKEAVREQLLHTGELLTVDLARAELDGAPG